MENQKDDKNSSSVSEIAPNRYRNDPHGHLARFLHQIFVSLKITPGVLNRMIRQSSILSKGRSSKSQVSNDRTNLLRAAENGYVTLNSFIKLIAVLQATNIRFDVTITHGNGKESYHHFDIDVGDTVAGMNKEEEDEVVLPFTGEDNDA